jgi:hypothetical protein
MAAQNAVSDLAPFRFEGFYDGLPAGHFRHDHLLANSKSRAGRSAPRQSARLRIEAVEHEADGLSLHFLFLIFLYSSSF